jgi:hypothetical protein
MSDFQNFDLTREHLMKQPETQALDSSKPATNVGTSLGCLGTFRYSLVDTSCAGDAVSGTKSETPRPLEPRFCNEDAEGWNAVAEWETARADRAETELNATKAELARRHDLLAMAFGQPKDQDGKCTCAYCRRDFEAIAEHAADLEMRLADKEAENERITKDRDGAMASLGREWIKNGELREQIERLKDERDELRAKLAEAEKDGERLDWLNDHWMEFVFGATPSKGQHLRQAIDTAMKGQR